MPRTYQRPRQLATVPSADPPGSLPPSQVLFRWLDCTLIASHFNALTDPSVLPFNDASIGSAALVAIDQSQDLQCPRRLPRLTSSSDNVLLLPIHAVPPPLLKNGCRISFGSIDLSQQQLVSCTRPRTVIDKLSTGGLDAKVVCK
ncbi:hypothetical protein PGTUg99_025994 [Puccinia graminis f. sp. tritici]|uniref:Uncharacterized protein n=1 Tax=Puccinia graminis f. sp. tritici TaxID=56615 RepID=A0A5B0PJ21_PUCGR|nr:hypothetical protein PGTUg99_025994 [Puccinia graminis f. sp. tritici]